MVSITAVLVSRFLLDLQEVDQDVRGQDISVVMSDDVTSKSVQFAAFVFVVSHLPSWRDISCRLVAQTKVGCYYE